MGDAQAEGAEARWAKSPKERLIVSLRISTDPDLAKIPPGDSFVFLFRIARIT
jgi:hypothetical protein